MLKGDRARCGQAPMRDLIDPKIEASVETALLALALRAYDEDPLQDQSGITPQARA